MKIGIMQPYFVPYIGYWQLINAVDKFVVYDNIKFTKKSWIRRNRILVNDSDKMITIPIKNDSDHLDIRDRYLSNDFETESRKILNLITMAYSRASEFDKVFPIIESIMTYESRNLFDFIFHSIIKVADYLDIHTEFVVSSNIDMDHSLKCTERVIETCRQLQATQYFNPIGGITLYDKEDFKRHGIELTFMDGTSTVYRQYGQEYVPNLSIIDVMMFNDVTKIKALLEDYSVI